MPFLSTPRDRAALLIFMLAAIVVVALTPFFSGLLGAAVLYVIFVHPYQSLEQVKKVGGSASSH